MREERRGVLGERWYEKKERKKEIDILVLF